MRKTLCLSAKAEKEEKRREETLGNIRKERLITLARLMAAIGTIIKSTKQ